MGWFVGVDAGSFSCKVALLGENGVAQALTVPAGTDYARAGRHGFERILERAGLRSEDVAAVVATGVGAGRIDFARERTGEVICTARGIAAVAPEVRTVIDVGAQSTRVIWLDETGRVAHFVANEKCATGSGRFLQVIANVLRVRLEEVGPLSLRAEHPVTFTTGCAVFGESEAITRVSEGAAKEDILAGVHRSLAEKIASLVRTRGLQGRYAVCGGGALDVGLLRCVEEELGAPPLVPADPEVVGAVGAAVQARRAARTAMEAGAGPMERDRRPPRATSRPGRMPPARPRPAPPVGMGERRGVKGGETR
ncbi:MAG: acyl-CoA dehydratase activase [Deferrisomatales bacterium]